MIVVEGAKTASVELAGGLRQVRECPPGSGAAAAGAAVSIPAGTGCCRSLWLLVVSGGDTAQCFSSVLATPVDCSSGQRGSSYSSLTECGLFWYISVLENLLEACLLLFLRRRIVKKIKVSAEERSGACRSNCIGEFSFCENWTGKNIMMLPALEWGR